MINATKAAQVFSVNGQFKPTKTSMYLLTNLFNNGYYFDVSSQTVIDASNFSSLTDNAQRVFYTDVETGYSGPGYLIYPTSIYSPGLSAKINVSAGATTVIDHIDGKKIRVTGWYVAASGVPGSYTWFSGVDAKTGVIPVGINGGVATDIQFTCGVGEDLNITVVGSDIDGIINYIVVDDIIDTNEILDAVVSIPAGSVGLKVLDHVDGKKIQVTGWYAGASVAAGSYAWLSGLVAKTGDVPVGINGGGTANIQITCGAGEDLNITTVGSKIDGIINYKIVDVADNILDAPISALAGSVGLSVVSGVAGKRIKVIGWHFGASVAAGTYTWLSGLTAKTGDVPVGVLGGGTPYIQITCGVGEDLNITTVGSKIDGIINYEMVDSQDEILNAVVDVPAASVGLKVLDHTDGKKIQVTGWYVGASLATGSYTWLSGVSDKTGIIPIALNGASSPVIKLTCGTDEDLNITTVGSDIKGVINYKIVDEVGDVMDALINVPAGSAGLKVIDNISGQKIKIVGWCIGASVLTGSYTWLSDTAVKTGTIPVAVNSGVATDMKFICGTGEDLKITTVNSDIDGIINYTVVENPNDYNIVKFPIKNMGNNDIYIRLRDINGVGSCNVELYIDSTLESTTNISFAGTDWEWSSLGTFNLINDNVYNLGIRLYTDGVAFDQIAINPTIPPVGSGALSLTASPFVTAHVGVYNVDGSFTPTTPLYIHDFKTSLDELRQDSWYNFDLNFIDSSLNSDFLNSYALYFSVSGSNGKNFITWERTNADEYSLEPSAYNG